MLTVDYCTPRYLLNKQNTYRLRIKLKKILIIAYPFPPIPYSGSYRIIRICKGLARLSVEIHALSINIDDNIPNDYDLLEQLPEIVIIHRTPIIDPWLKYQKWKKNNKDRKGFKYINKILSFLLRLITIPDHQIFWIPFAVLNARRIIKKHHIKSILVSSPPNSSQFIGYFLKKITKVKWIADFRDPIVGNIAATHLISPKGFMSRIESRILIALEKLVVKNADIGIANTETHRRELTKNFNTDKFVTIRNSFDEDDYKGISGEKYDKFTVSHLGSMYGLRKADVLFKAIKKLEGSVAPEPLKLQVQFVGSNDLRLKQQVCDYGVERYIEIKGMVSHKKAIEIMVKSHLLLLIKATGEGNYGQIPAKFFEYLGAGNRILYLGPQISEVAEIMHRLNCGYTIGNDKEEMFSVLRKEYTAFLNGDRFSLDSSITNEFSSYKMAANVVPLIS